MLNDVVGTLVDKINEITHDYVQSSIFEVLIIWSYVGHNLVIFWSSS